MSALAELVEREIAAGRPNATLIEWADRQDLFGESARDAECSIRQSMSEFAANGWKRNDKTGYIEKGEWHAFYRSQGLLSPPIIQWSRINKQEKQK